MFDEAFLKLIRCPVHHSPLASAEPSLVERLNAEIERGELTNRLGEKVEDRLDGGLVNADRSLLYPVRNEIPTLIADEAIVLNGSSPADETLDKSGANNPDIHDTAVDKRGV